MSIYKIEYSKSQVIDENCIEQDQYQNEVLDKEVSTDEEPLCLCDMYRRKNAEAAEFIIENRNKVSKIVSDAATACKESALELGRTLKETTKEFDSILENRLNDAKKRLPFIQKFMEDDIRHSTEWWHESVKNTETEFKPIKDILE